MLETFIPFGPFSCMLLITLLWKTYIKKILFTKSVRFLFYSLCLSLYKLTSVNLFQYQGDKHYIKWVPLPYNPWCLVKGWWWQWVLRLTRQYEDNIWVTHHQIPFRFKICVNLYRKINSYFFTDMSCNE